MSAAHPPPATDEAAPPKASVRAWVAERIDRLFGALSLWVLLAVIATIPILQFFALGYLLRVAARYAETGEVRASFNGVREASRIGQFALGAWLVTLLPRLVVSLRQDALLVAPGAGPAKALGAMSLVAALVVGWIALVALGRGGRLVHFVRPIRATRELVADVRTGGWLGRVREEIAAVWRSFDPVGTFSLGFRGYVGAMVWLVVPTTLIAVGKKGLLAVLGGLGLALVVLHLPFLQVHFAVKGKLMSMFELKAARAVFRGAPFAHFVALFVTLLLAVPLYLLKVEIPPAEALWVAAAVFVLTILPTKLLAAWAYRRGTAAPEPKHIVATGSMRTLTFVAAVLYAVIVFLTQYTGWHGSLGLFEQHAFLLPAPFGTPRF